MPASKAASAPARLRQEARWQKALWKMATHPAIGSGDFAQAREAICAVAAEAFPADRAVCLESGNDAWLIAAVKSGPCPDLVQACKRNGRRKAEQLLQSLQLGSAAAAPVRLGSETAAVFLLGNRRPRRFTYREVDFASDVAAQLSTAMLGARRRATEEELRNSQQVYRWFVEFTREAVWHVMIDPPIATTLPPDEQIELIADRARLVHCNDAMARIRGFASARDMMGARLRDIFGPLDEARRRDIRAVIDSNYSVREFEALYLFPGLGPRWVQRNMVGVVRDGLLTELWGASRDITERKQYEESLRQSEQRYRAFVNNSSLGIFRIEFPQPIHFKLPEPRIDAAIQSEGMVAECNEALAAMRGYMSPEPLIGQPAAILGFPLGPVAQEGFRADGLETSFLDAQGALKWFRYSVTGIVEDGKLVRIWGTVADVTERRRMRQEMRALSARRAALLEQERTRIAREIHDDLGQQLTALKFDIAAQRGLCKTSKAELAKSVDAAIHALRRIAADLRPPILDHFGLAAAAEWQAREFAKRTGIACECNAAQNLDIPRDLATTVFRILQEALTNVARHSGASLARVEISAGPAYLSLIVSDNGRGIRTEESAGTASLGLAGMRERASDAGGQVSIRANAPGSGTIVEAHFPIAVAEEIK